MTGDGRRNAALIGLVEITMCIAVLALTGCNDSGRRGGGGSADGGGGGGECADLSGSWTVTNHCSESFVGMVADVSQSGCAFTIGAPFDGFAGTSGSGGAVSITGNVEGEAITCTGSASTGVMDLDCTGDCTVQLTRGDL